MKTSDSITKISSALLKAQKSMGNAVKDAKNPFYKSFYADLNAIREAALPSLHENGIATLQPTVSVDGKQFVQTTLLHESGEYIASLTEIVCAKQNDPQAYGSAISYARRYGLQSLLCIGAEDNDAEAAMGRTSTKQVTAPTPAKAVIEDATPKALSGNGSFRKQSPVKEDSKVEGWD